MNFQDLQRVETYQTYLDIAFSQGKKAIKEINQRTTRQKEKKELIKDRELKRLHIIERSLTGQLMRLLKKFPAISTLPPFYLALVKATTDYVRFKQSLGAINWAVKKANNFSRVYERKIKLAREMPLTYKLSKEYVGRISSIMKQISGPLIFLENARKTMKRFPAIKTESPTVAIYGFPNVGKTTLLSKLTSSKPEINSYAFTTRNLNVGNLNLKSDKIQVVDTPGTLNRSDKMNAIEQQAELVLKHVADLFIYVFDLTEPFPLDEQKKLYKKLHALNKPVIMYVSKADIIGSKKIAEFNKSAIYDIKKLKKQVLSKLSLSDLE